MSDSNRPSSPSAFWILAILPAALGVVWLIGRLPEPEAKAPVEAVGSAPGHTGTDLGGHAIGEGGASLQRVTGPSSEPVPARDVTATGPSSWTTPQGAMDESQRTGKPIMLEFTAEWSPEAQQLRSQVFSSAILGPAVQAEVIPVSVVDREREDGENPPAILALREQFKVTSVPTLVVFSPHTGRMVSSRGFSGADETLRWVKRAAEAVR